MTKEIKEKSIIDVCIERSRSLAKMRKTRVVGRTFQLALQDCPMIFPSEDKLKDLQEELKNRISEYEMSMGAMINTITVPHGINVDHKFWFSDKEIKEGYILLRKLNSLGATHVLFLKDQIDSFDTTEYKQGDIRLYKHVNHFLERIDADIELKKTQRKSNKNE